MVWPIHSIVAGAVGCSCHISPAAVAKTGCNQHAVIQQKRSSAQMLWRATPAKIARASLFGQARRRMHLRACLAMYEQQTCSTRHASTRLLRRPPQCDSTYGTSASATTLIAGCRQLQTLPSDLERAFCMHTGCQLEADCSGHGAQQHILTTSLWHFRALLLTSCSGVLSARLRPKRGCRRTQAPASHCENGTQSQRLRWHSAPLLQRLQCKWVIKQHHLCQYHLWDTAHR